MATNYQDLLDMLKPQEEEKLFSSIEPTSQQLISPINPTPEELVTLSQQQAPAVEEIAEPVQAPIKTAAQPVLKKAPIEQSMESGDPGISKAMDALKNWENRPKEEASSITQTQAPATEAPMSESQALLAEYNKLLGKGQEDLAEARRRDRMLKVGGSLGDALATYLNARSQMNVKAPGVQVQQGAGLGKIADMFATAPEIASDMKQRREDLLAKYKLLASGKDGEKIYQTKSGLVKIDKDGKPIELYSDPSTKRSLDLTERRIKQGGERLGLSSTAEERRLDEFQFKKKEADELKPKELETLTGIDSTLDSLDRLSGLNKDFWTGPIEGRVSQLSRILGTDSEAKTKLAAQMEMVLSKYAKQISGTAVGEQEFERLKNQLPNETDSNNAFAAKFSNFKEELESSRSRFIQNYGKVRNVESFKERTPLQQNQQTQIKAKDLPIGTVKNKGGVDYIKKETGWEPVK